MTVGEGKISKYLKVNVRDCLKSFFCLFLLAAGLTACGSSGGPFEMQADATAVVGDTGGSPIQFIVDPQQLSSQGTLTAQVDQVFSDRRTLIIQDLDILTTFPGVGEVRITLNPNLPSTGVVYKLNKNNQPDGTHMMDLNLIVETPEQNLTYDDVILSGQEATITLDSPLPALTFFFQGDSKQYQLLDMSVVIPASLITSDRDPNFSF